MKLRTLLVDDELHCLETLKYDLGRHVNEHVEIVGEAQSISDAMVLFIKTKPDLILLDIDLPDMSGMEFLEKIGEINSRVIFTTAHSKYAIPAYRFKAEGFLLKPIDVQELKSIILEVHQKASQKSGFLTNRLSIPETGGITYVPYEEVVACQASNNYSVIYLKNGSQKTISKTLKSLEEILNDQVFIRIHQSYLVNINHIHRYLKSDGGSLQMSNESIYPISKSYRDRVMHLLM